MALAAYTREGPTKGEPFVQRKKGHTPSIRNGLLEPLAVAAMIASSATAWASNETADAYVEKLRKARAEYAEHLKTTWTLDVIARPALRPGSQTIGRAPGNDIAIGICPDRLGTIRVESGMITMELDESAKAKFQDSDRRSGEMKKGYGYTNRIECDDGFLYANHEGVLRIVKPGAGPDPVPRFHDIDIRWRITGRYLPLRRPVERTYVTSNGKEDKGFVYGRLRFELDGTAYELEPNPVPEEFADYGAISLPFWDRTNGKTTYGGGRYVNVQIPAGKQSEQVVTIDFNDAYNPTCVFDVSISCALPPPENRLRTAVTAGEMMPEQSGAPPNVGGPGSQSLP